jgi:hypothetical protein
VNKVMLETLARTQTAVVVAHQVTLTLTLTSFTRF